MGKREKLIDRLTRNPQSATFADLRNLLEYIDRDREISGDRQAATNRSKIIAKLFPLGLFVSILARYAICDRFLWIIDRPSTVQSIERS